MANPEAKHKDNVGGSWYCTDPDDDNGEGCIACNVCYTGAPDFFAEDEDGNAYIKKQPTTPEEVELCQEQLHTLGGPFLWRPRPWARAQGPGLAGPSPLIPWCGNLQLSNP